MRRLTGAGLAGPAARAVRCIWVRIPAGEHGLPLVAPRSTRDNAPTDKVERRARSTILTAGQARLRDMSGKRGQLGASTNLSKSPERQARDRARRKRQDERWARKSGPVTSRFVCPICGGPHSRAEHPDS